MKTITKKKYNLLDIVLLKYETFNLQGSINIQLKYVLSLIYNFNKKNKIIMFIGVSQSKLLNSVALKSKHIFLSANTWKHGLFKNKLFIKQNKKSTPDLIVFFTDSLKNKDIIFECNKFNKPIIVLNFSSYDFKGFEYVKVVPIKQYKKKIKSFCFYLISSTLKKK